MIRLLIFGFIIRLLIFGGVVCFVFWRGGYSFLFIYLFLQRVVFYTFDFLNVSFFSKEFILNLLKLGRNYFFL